MKKNISEVIKFLDDQKNNFTKRFFMTSKNYEVEINKLKTILDKLDN